MFIAGKLISSVCVGFVVLLGKALMREKKKGRMFGGGNAKSDQSAFGIKKSLHQRQ
ncbi:hypothetical protein U1Q18_041471, partial [Sarracenia purpurea var. burkii]